MTTQQEEMMAILREEMQAEVQKNLPGPLPKQVPVYHKLTGKPPPTPNGLIYRVDVPEYCDPRGLDQAGRQLPPPQYVRTRAEVQIAEPEAEAPARAFPGSSSGVPEDDPPAELDELRARFEEVTGRKPHHNLGRDKLEAGISAG